MKTKHYLLLNAILLSSILTYAQWSTDSANPGVVCDYAGIQSNPTAFADENGGVYVFWLDHRNGNNQDALDVYGQHYDSEGYALWEENGRMIVHHYKRISWFSANRFDNGEIILGWITDNDGEFGDTLFVQRLDADGMKVWTNDLAVANNAGNPIYILGMYGFNIIHDDAGYCISIGVVYYGGSSGNRITRFTSNGVLTGWYNGEPEGTQYNFGSSGLESCYDANNNVYLYYSNGNGSGASLLCLKVDMAGDTVWGPVNVLTGTSGLSYQFSGFSDENGITFVWQGNGDIGNGTNLYARRLNTDGSFAWSGSTATICAADGNQDNFYCKKSGDNFYITWADGRPGVSPGNFDIYAQKFGINGNILWAENGIEVISLNTYITYPKFAFSDDNSMIVCHQSTGGWGFVAQKVLDGGTTAWGENGEQICIPAFNPFYQEHTEVQSGENTIAVWAKAQADGGSNDIYITRIDNLNITGESEISTSGFRVYPNPALENIFVDIPENMGVSTISLFDIYGRMVFHSEFNENSLFKRIKIPTSELLLGVYVIRIENGKELYSEKLVVK